MRRLRLREVKWFAQDHTAIASGLGIEPKSVGPQSLCVSNQPKLGYSWRLLNNLFHLLAAPEKRQKPQWIQLLSRIDFLTEKSVKARQTSKDLGSNPTSGKWCQLGLSQLLVGTLPQLHVSPSRNVLDQSYEKNLLCSSICKDPLLEISKVLHKSGIRSLFFLFEPCKLFCHQVMLIITITATVPKGLQCVRYWATSFTNTDSSSQFMRTARLQ